MTAVTIILRIALFLAIVVPTVIWFARRVREGTPSDREVARTVDRHIELGRNRFGPPM